LSAVVVDEGEEMDTFIMERAGRERVSNTPSAGWINLLHAPRPTSMLYVQMVIFLAQECII